MLGFGHTIPKLRANPPAAPTFFDTFGTPAQAWALWDVDGGGGNYVEVQRTSDDTTRNFKMSEIASEADVSWVNSDLFSFADDFAGGSTTGLGVNNTTISAPETIGGETDAMQVTLTGGNVKHDFSVIGLEINQRYDVSFEVYYPSSNTAVDGVRFTDISGLETTYGTADTWVAVTLSDVTVVNNILKFFASDGGGITINADGDTFSIRNLTVTQLSSTGLVKSWYNPASGLTATQTNASDMPVIVDMGVGVSDNGKRAIESDGSQFLTFTTTTLTGAFCIMAVHNGTGFLAGQSVGGNDIIRLTGSQRIFIDGSSYQNFNNRDNLQTLSTFNRTAGNSLSIYYNETEGINSPFAGASGDWGTDSILSYKSGAVIFTGKIQGFLMYDEDKSADLAAMQEFIVNEFSIS